MYSGLKEIFNDITSIPDKDWNTFETTLKPLHFDKDDFLLKEGQICRGIYFISKGAVRTYHLNDGKEINTSFNFENEFVRELESLSSGKPSKSNIQAMEYTEVMFIDKVKLTLLYDESPAFQTLGRKILEQISITEQKYASLLATYSPQERYSYILQNHPELIQRIPLQYLASYLGIARETLSRIRKRLS